MTNARPQFPAFLPVQPVAFMRDNVCFGGTWHDGEVMGNFGLVGCQVADPCNTALGGKIVLKGATPVRIDERNPVTINAFALVFNFRRGVSALPAGWFFVDAQGARETARAFCLWAARWLLNSSIPGIKRADDGLYPMTAVQGVAAGGVPVWLVSRHKNKLMRIASRHGAVMGRDHDLRALYQSLDHGAISALQAAQLSGPTAAHFIEQTGRVTAFPAPPKRIGE